MGGRISSLQFEVRDFCALFCGTEAKEGREERREELSGGRSEERLRVVGLRELCRLIKMNILLASVVTAAAVAPTYSLEQKNAKTTVHGYHYNMYV